MIYLPGVLFYYQLSTIVSIHNATMIVGYDSNLTILGEWQHTMQLLLLWIAQFPNNHYFGRNENVIQVLAILVAMERKSKKLLRDPEGEDLAPEVFSLSVISRSLIQISNGLIHKSLWQRNDLYHLQRQRTPSPTKQRVETENRKPDQGIAYDGHIISGASGLFLA